MAKKAKRARKHSSCSPITCDHGTSGGKNLSQEIDSATTPSLPPIVEGISTKENARELLGSEEEVRASFSQWIAALRHRCQSSSWAADSNF